MAAGSLSEAFNFELKRKRRYDDDDDESIHDHDLFSKRRNLTQLPIRSPQRPTIAVTPAFGHYSIPPGTLTPDSIPEDVTLSITSSDTANYPSQQRSHSDPNSSSTKLRINVSMDHGDSQDMDMDLSSPKESAPPTLLRIGRARSNDLMSPVRSPVTTSLLSPRANAFARDRLPTPTTSTFPARSPFETSFASAAARQLRPHLRQQSTTLSPMVDAESWTPPVQRPPSPGPELDEPFNEDSAMGGIEESNNMSSSFTQLSVHSQDSLNDLPSSNSPPVRTWSSHSASTSPKNRGLGLDNPQNNFMRPDSLRMSTIMDTQRPATAHGMGLQHCRNQSNGRTAKLHMGFKTDCEKCIARVPGHYSHIIWS